MGRRNLDLEGIAEMFAQKCGNDHKQSALNIGRHLQTDAQFKQLVRLDLADMNARLPLDLVRDEFREALLVQSVLGHVQQGHGQYFTRNAFPQATIRDITNATRRGHNRIKNMRQSHINLVHEWTDRAIEGKARRFVHDGQPLLGVGFLRDYVIKDMKAVMQGMVLAGYMDNFEARTATLKRFKHQTVTGKKLEIGGGETFLVDLELLTAYGQNPNSLGEIAYSNDQIDYLRSLGIIHNERNGNPNIESTYIRRRMGGGTSDDLAFLMIGHMFGVDAMYGAFVVDAIDTYDKCVMYPVSGGIDEALGKFVESSWKFKYGEKLVTDRDISNVIYFSAKGNNPRIAGSSSHRRLIEEQGTQRALPVFLQHVEHFEGRPTAKFQVGFGGPQSPYFYHAANKRAEYMKDAA